MTVGGVKSPQVYIGQRAWGITQIFGKSRDHIPPEIKFSGFQGKKGGATDGKRSWRRASWRGT